MVQVQTDPPNRRFLRCSNLRRRQLQPHSQREKACSRRGGAFARGYFCEQQKACWAPVRSPFSSAPPIALTKARSDRRWSALAQCHEVVDVCWAPTKLPDFRASSKCCTSGRRSLKYACREVSGAGVVVDSGILVTPIADIIFSLMLTC